MIYQKVSSLHNINLSPVGDHVPRDCLLSVNPEHPCLSDFTSAAVPHPVCSWLVSPMNLCKLDWANPVNTQILEIRMYISLEGALLYHPESSSSILTNICA